MYIKKDSQYKIESEKFIILKNNINNIKNEQKNKYYLSTDYKL